MTELTSSQIYDILTKIEKKKEYLNLLNKMQYTLKQCGLMCEIDELNEYRQALHGFAILYGIEYLNLVNQRYKDRLKK